MRREPIRVAVWWWAWGVAAAIAATGPVPYGHKDFYPSPERPIGFRADGTGNYSGATPVTEWWEGTVGEAPSRGRKWTDRNAKNVVWKTKLPGWSDTQPVVVGDRVVGIADPDWVFCVDAHTGKMLWQDRLMPMFLGPPPTNGVPSRCPFSAEEAWKRQQVADIARALFYLGGAVGSPGVDGERLERAVKAAYDLRDVAVRLDPSPGIAGAFEEFIARLEELQGASVQGRAEAAKKVGFGLVAGRLLDWYRLLIVQVWMGDVGLTQSSPVTDGECVYVALGQGPIACYDLTGRRRWAWREVDYQLRALYCDHTPSLVLADGVLLVRSHFGDIMGLDPKTGAILHNTDIGPSYNHGAFATPGVMRLTSPGGKKLTVLVTQHDKVIGVKDGKVLAEMPFLKSGDVGHGQPRMVWNDLVVYQSSQAVPPDGGPAIVVRVKLADDGTVTTEKVHNFGGARFGNVPMALTSEGRLLGGTRTGSGGKKGPRPLEALGGGSLWSLADGTPFAGTDGPGFSEGGGVVIAGRYAFHCIHGRWGPDGWSQGAFGAYELTAPDSSKSIEGRRELWADEPPADVDVDTWLPPEFRGISRPYWFGLRNGGVVPSGNRLFAQTASFLYCLGDASKPYDWNPESRPAALREALAAHEAAETRAGPVSGLASLLTWNRERAAAALRALPNERKAALASELAALLAAGEWPGFDAALAALREMGPVAAPAAPGMLAAARAALVANRAAHVGQIVGAVAIVAPGRQAELAPDVAKRLAASDVAALTAACAAAGSLGAAGQPCVAGLTRLVEHADDRVGSAAARALALIGQGMDAAVPALIARLASGNPAVVVAALDGLRAAGVAAQPAMERVAGLLAAPDPDVASAAAKALAARGAAAKPWLGRLVKAFPRASQAAMQELALAALAIAPDQEVAIADGLATTCGDADAQIARSATRLLGKFAPSWKDRRAKTVAVTALADAVKSRSGALRHLAVQALGEIGPAAEAALPVLRVEANGTECPAAAKAAIQKIKPGADTGPESGVTGDDLL